MVIMTGWKVIIVVILMQVDVILKVNFEDALLLAPNKAFLKLNWEPFLRLPEVQRA